MIWNEYVWRGKREGQWREQKILFWPLDSLESLLIHEGIDLLTWIYFVFISLASYSVILELLHLFLWVIELIPLFRSKAELADISFVSTRKLFDFLSPDTLSVRWIP